VTTRTLDYIPRLVEANRRFRLTAADPALLKTSRWWTGGVVLDQGQEGSCVGHGVVGEYLASPVRGNPFVVTPGAMDTKDRAGHQLAVAVYNRAKEIDEWEGVNYEGTSVRAGMLVARERAWCDSFNWAFNLLELRAALEDGPVVIGFDVHDRMFDTEPDGDWIPDGPVEGGHCALVTGYSANYAGRGPRYRVRNSWGHDWGSNGNAYISPENLDKVLFQSGGEAAVPTGRHL
jgi:hypothetical protein